MRPSADTVKAHFGSWSKAIVAAGYPRPFPGFNKTRPPFGIRGDLFQGRR